MVLDGAGQAVCEVGTTRDVGQVELPCGGVGHDGIELCQGSIAVKSN